MPISFSMMVVGSLVSQRPIGCLCSTFLESVHQALKPLDVLADEFVVPLTAGGEPGWTTDRRCSKGNLMAILQSFDEATNQPSSLKGVTQ